MFKASIALVLIAFAALAYGWIAGNDSVLYASIGASALAGLALLRSSRAEKKAATEPGAKPSRERPAKPAKAERARDVRSDLPPAGGSRKRDKERLSSSEAGRQLDTEDETEFFEAGSESVKPFRPVSERKSARRAPEGAAWATPEEDELSEFEAEYEPEEAAHEAGFEDQGYLGDEGYAEPEVSYSRESAAAADDFRSRLAAVLGSTGDQDSAAALPLPERRRARKVKPPPAEEEPEPPRRGRKRSAQPVVASEPEPELEPEGEPEPDWIRIDDVPRIRRATQPGGGFARPDIPAGITPYRPRRPGVPKPQEPEPVEEPPPAPARRRQAPAERTAASKVKTVSSNRPPAASKSSVTRVSGGEGRARPPKEVDPEAPRPRRGRPPKTKP